ncbi:hypothetical protein D5085_17685 [Ectothiorhodospiraceae bacterium BW-2]|nr:hypothetical protein D5085_17685 [Ectothiorhodospiraceae bacterium BW-2]
MLRGGFVDLRHDSSSDHGAGSFWPSFTDIMMVVVMIFMLASTVLVLRNFELVKELSSTMEAEQLASRLAEVATETNATLEEQLSQTQYQVSELRMKLMQREEANELMTQMLQDQDKQLTDLNGQLQRLRGDLSQQSQLARESQQQLQQTREVKQQLEQLLQTEQQRLESLQQNYQQQVVDYETLKRLSRSSDQRLSLVQGQYEQLKVEYDKLVRPARTAQGKYVVDVRYRVEAGAKIIEYHLPGEAGYTQLSLPELHQKLQQLQQQHHNQLYIKVIIPDNSGLSYNEAWEFTQKVLSRYDYYYQ